MSELNRYELVPDGGYPTSGVMEATEHGEYVRYEDVERLQRIEAAARELVESTCTHRDVQKGLEALRKALG